MTPLLCATSRGHIECMKLLLDAGVDKDAVNDEGWTPLMYAAAAGFTDGVKLLLDYGVNVNKTDNDGWTALMIAAMNWDNNIQKLLLDAGAEVNIVNSDGKTALIIADDNHVEELELLINATYNDVADKVLNVISKQDIIFDTAFIIFKKTLKNTIPNEYINIDNKDIHEKIYKLFQEKFSKFNNKTP